MIHYGFSEKGVMKLFWKLITKQYHMIVLLNCVHLNGQKLGSRSQTEKLEPPCNV